MGDNTKLVLHSVADKSLPNYAVESVSAPRSVFDPKKAQIQATISAFGAPASKRTVTLLVNGKPSGSKTVLAIGPGLVEDIDKLTGTLKLF